MCWYSADHAEQILQAEAGQRLVIRKVHGSSWAVQETALQKTRPTPVCLVDRTRVLFRSSELEQTKVLPAPECEAVFRMLKNPKRDVFQFSDGRELDVNSLPSNLVFDVLEIPGKEELSQVLKEDTSQNERSEPAATRESLLERIFARL
jgi:hypothetical protein